MILIPLAALLVALVGYLIGRAFGEIRTAGLCQAAYQRGYDNGIIMGQRQGRLQAYDDMAESESVMAELRGNLVRRDPAELQANSETIDMADALRDMRNLAREQLDFHRPRGADGDT